MDLLISPHNDDEALWASFTLLRHRPLVVIVTDSWIQWNRGDGITAKERWNESVAACAVLGCEARRLGIRDDAITFEHVVEALALAFPPNQLGSVYAPARQGGHPHHDLVSRAAASLYNGQVIEYCTYSRTDPFYANTGAVAVHGDEREWALKRQALDCYPSQHHRSAGHFAAVLGKPEWITPPPSSPRTI